MEVVLEHQSLLIKLKEHGSRCAMIFIQPHQGVEHDDMNLLCIGSRIIGIEVAKELVKALLKLDTLEKKGIPED